MTLNPAMKDRIESLLDQPSLTAAERSELNETLLNDESARVFAYQCLEMTAWLQSQAIVPESESTQETVSADGQPVSTGTRPGPPSQPSSPGGSGGAGWLVAVAASLALVGMGFWWTRTKAVPGNTPEAALSGTKTPAGWAPRTKKAVAAQMRLGCTTEPKHIGFAVITREIDAVWASGKTVRIGDLISSDAMHLESGTVTLELLSGASVQLDGESEFEIRSPMEMFVHRGKVRASVPPAAHGFRLLTAIGEVVDLGTEFGVDVSPEQCEVHVLDGEITWSGDRSGQGQSLVGGQAVRRTRDGGEEFIDLDRDHFLNESDLQRRWTLARKRRLEQWRRDFIEVRRDPRLVCLYQTDRVDTRSRRLPNAILESPDASGQPRIGEGAIVAASRTKDRWQRSDRALDFGPAGSSVRLLIPGEYQSLTLSCWVKIDSLDQPYNSLLLTDGYDLNEPHWQISRDGRIYFNVKRRDVWDQSIGEADKHDFCSPSIWTPEIVGQWIMLTTTYDVESMQVTHFLNGEPISREAIPPEYLVKTVRIGRASLCNWNEPERQYPDFVVRNLNGSLDEFSLYRAALGEDEIHGLYQIGKP